jgi:hypothetical protein
VKEVRVYSLAEAATLPKPEPLIEDLLFANGYSALVGPSGVGKSFIAIALAVAVASGTPFFGRATKAGAVVYVAPEGSSTLARRVSAAMRAASVPRLDNFFLVPDAVYLHDGAAVSAFLAALRARISEPIALILFDTLAKCSAGMDENSNSDRELTNAGLDFLRSQTGAHTLVVHHTGWNEERERGATALRANVDTLLHLKRDDSAVLLTATKQRDMEDGGTIRLALAPLDDSLVVTEPGADLLPESLPTATRKALEALDQIALSDGSSCSAWLASSGLAPSTFYRARKDLVVRGYVSGVGRGKYIVSPEGRELLPTPTVLPHYSHGSRHTTSSHFPPLKGGSGGSARVLPMERGDAWEPEAVGNVG